MTIQKCKKWHKTQNTIDFYTDNKCVNSESCEIKWKDLLNKIDVKWACRSDLYKQTGVKEIYWDKALETGIYQLVLNRYWWANSVGCNRGPVSGTKCWYWWDRSLWPWVLTCVLSQIKITRWSCSHRAHILTEDPDTHSNLITYGIMWN